MEQLGEYLRNERLKRGISLAEVQRKTKIRSHYLEAIENGQFHIIPAETYLKGFLYSYGQAIGLDGWDIVARYKLSRKEAPVDTPKIKKNTSRTPLFTWGIVACLLILSIYLFSGGKQPQSPSDEVRISQPLPDPVDALLSQEEEEDWLGQDTNWDEESTQITDEEIIYDLPVAKQDLPHEVDQLVEETEDDVSVAELIGEEEETEEQAPVTELIAQDEELSDVQEELFHEQESPSSRYVVQGQVLEASWFEVHADGQRIVYRILEPGAQIHWQAQEGLWIRIGNTQGVNLELNGQPLHLSERNVMNLEFGQRAREPRN